MNASYVIGTHFLTSDFELLEAAHITGRLEALYIFKEVICGREEQKMDHMGSAVPVESEAYHTANVPMKILLAEKMISDFNTLPGMFRMTVLRCSR